MKKAKLIISLCILFAGFFGYVLGSKNLTKLNIQASDNSNQITLEYQPIKTSGIDEATLAKVEEFMADFYKNKQQGKYTTTGYYIREIRPLEDSTVVFVDELRTMYSGGEYVGYLASISNLVFEIEEKNNEFKILRYYHKGVKDASPNEGYSDY